MLPFPLPSPSPTSLHSHSDPPVKSKLRTSEDVYHRLVWSDPTTLPFDVSSIQVGYEDRFLGRREVPLSKFVVGGDIPFHRIYYFRTGGQAPIMLTEEGKRKTISPQHWPPHAVVVWDRLARVDRIFGSGEQGLVSTPSSDPSSPSPHSQPSLPLIASHHRYHVIPSYRFLPPTQRWCPHSGEGLDTPFSPPSPLSESHQMTCITYNVLHHLYPDGAENCTQRWSLLLSFLSSLNADLIALQEVTPLFLHLLLSTPWIRQSYYVTDVQEDRPHRHSTDVAPTVDPSGQLLLSRFPPSAVYHRKGQNKMSLIATYDLSPTRVLCVANLHLTSDHHRPCSEKRQQQIQELMEACPWSAADGKLVDVLLMGDTNMQDEEPIPSDYADCGGYDPTYDPLNNALAGRISRSGRVSRYDRMLLRRGIPSGGGAVWKCTTAEVIGKEAVRVEFLQKEDERERYIGPGDLFFSDHYGLLCRFDFSSSSPLDSALIRSDPPVPTSAVVLLPPDSLNASIQAIRQHHDPAFKRWPPHVNLLFGFVSESRLEDASTVLREVCRGVAPFTVALGPLDVFRHRRTSTVYATLTDPHHHVRRLQAALQAAYPLCSQQSSHSEGGFTPHCTVAKVQSRVEPLLGQWSESALAWAEQSFEVGEVVVLSRRGDEPFHIYERIPLTGKACEAKRTRESTVTAISTQLPIRAQGSTSVGDVERQRFDASTWSLDCEVMNGKDSTLDSLHHFLTERGLFPSAEAERLRLQVVETVRSICQRIILQACAADPNDDFTSFPELSHVIGSAGLCSHLPTSDTDVLVCGPWDFTSREFFDALRQRLENSPSHVSDAVDLPPFSVRLVLEALVPVATIRCGGQTVDVQYSRFPSHRSPLNCRPSSLTTADLKVMDTSSSRALCGLLDLFQIQQRIPSTIRPAFTSSLRCLRYWASTRGLHDTRLGFLGGHSWALMLTSVCEGVKEWGMGVTSDEIMRRFFQTFAAWPWPRGVELEGNRTGRPPASLQVALMPVLCPTPPHHNSSRGVCRSTLNVLRAELSRGAAVLNTQHIDPPSSVWPQLCQPSSFHLDYPLQLRLLVTARDAAFLAECVGVVEAGLLGLVAELERLDMAAVPHRGRDSLSGVKAVELLLGLGGRLEGRGEEVKVVADAFVRRSHRAIPNGLAISITASLISHSA